MKKALALVLTLVMVFSMISLSSAEEKTSFKIGICNFVDDASLNQIIANIRERLGEIGQEKGVTFEIVEDNCNLDTSVMQQIIANFIAEEVDLMVGVATPVAMGMQGMTADNQIPVVFAAVSDPLGAVQTFPCTTLLKGATTLIHANGKIAFTTFGNPGLAKGGSGDVLTGMIGAFLAKGMPAFEAISEAGLPPASSSRITRRRLYCCAVRYRIRMGGSFRERRSA